MALKDNFQNNNKNSNESEKTQALWNSFQQSYKLTDYQIEQFKLYYKMLKATNELHNLTTITELKPVVRYHFEDSIALCKALMCQNITSLADIGSGGGFPGVPLKILYPEMPVTLIEVSHKKNTFLYSVIEKLDLKNIFVSELDWRTFLRKTEYNIELFCARASLQPIELIRAFKPSSPYKEAQVIYWASNNWKPEEKVASFIKNEFTYKVGNKTRQLIFFGV